jgi:Putative transposase
VVDSKQPFAGPEQVLRYLSRYTHRVAISDHRLVDVDDDHVTFTWKDYRNEASVALMTLSPAEFMRRFLLHVLPERIRHHCQRHSASQARPHPAAACSATAGRARSNPRHPHGNDCTRRPRDIRWHPTCPECGGEMQIVETLPKALAMAFRGSDTS